MAKGVPTARSQRFKATQKLQEKITSTPTNLGNDVLPSPISVPEKPTFQAEGAQRAFTTVHMLHQALLHAANPGTHIYDLLQLLGLYLTDCHDWYKEEVGHNAAGRKQLDEANSKLINQFDVQNAEILKLQDELTVSREKQEFYRRQAEKAILVPPFRRRRLVTTDSDNALTSDQLFKQVMWDRDDIRDSKISRLEDLQLKYEATIDQLLLSTSTWIDRQEELCKLHLGLRARQKICDSAVAHYRDQLIECQAQGVECKSQADREAQTLLQANTQLLESSAKYNKLAAQVTAEDQLFRDLLNFRYEVRRMYGPMEFMALPQCQRILEIRPHLQPKASGSY